MSMLNRFLKPGGNLGWVTVDSSAGDLCCVAVELPQRAGGKPVVTCCVSSASAELDKGTLEQFAAAVGGAKHPWCLVLGRKNYRFLVAEEPAVRPVEMEQSIRWAISTMIDFPIDDASVAWMRIPTGKFMPNRAPHVYVAATRNDTVTGLRDLFKEAKLPLKAVDVRETAHRNIASMIPLDPEEGIAMLSISHRGVQLTISYQGELYLDRYVDEALFNDFADPAVRERACERLVLQVQRSIDFVARTLPFIDIRRVILSPLPGEIGLRERLAENIPVEVESLNLADIFDFTQVPELMAPDRQAHYLVALGAALRLSGGRR